jgi:hypothetical protein
MVQLTEEITYSVTDPAQFEQVRSAARNHLNHNAFFDLNNNPILHKYDIFGNDLA